MKKSITALLVLIAILGLHAGVPATWAGIGDEDGHENETLTISGDMVTSSSANYYIGYTGSDNRVEILNGGILWMNEGNVVLGGMEGSQDNELLISGNWSILQVPANRALYIGRTGDYNRVFVEDFAELSVGRCFVGYASDHNLLVAEENAYLALGRLNIGEYGSHNEAFVRLGAEVDLTEFLRLGHFQGAEDNAAHISGHGTLLTTPIIEIGEQAWGDYSGSLLTISNGAQVHVAQHVRIVSGTDSRIEVGGGARVTSASAYIAGRGNANDNRIVIRGAGTTWTNTGAFVVNANAGASGSRVEIRDGAVLNAASQDGAMEVRANGTLLLDGGTLITPELLVLANGTLTGTGDVEGDGDIAGIFRPLQPAGDLDFSGDLTLHSSFGLHIELSGTGQDVSARIGAASITGDSGTLLFSLHPDYEPEDGDQIAFEMTGHLAGMTWDTDDSLLPPGWIADTGNLETDGYITLLYDEAYLWNIGDEDEHAGQTWLIDGEDVTSWSAAVFIGNTGADNELVITNAGTLHLGASNAHLYIGDKEGGDSNRVVVTGTGSSLTVTTGRDIYLGRGSSEDPGGAYNNLVVDDGGYLATRRLVVGFYGSHNHVYIQNGSAVDLTGFLRLGYYRGAENNEAHISGEGTTLNTPFIDMGEQAFSDYSGSLLSITDGAEVNVATHVRIVSGTDSRIEVAGGARVTSASAYITGRANANDNRIVLSGEGTTWTNTGAFIVNNIGDGASGTRLEIRDGAVLNAASQEGTMEVRANGTLQLDAGTLITPELLVLANGTLAGAGIIEGDGDIAGIFRPLQPAGDLDFSGDLTLQSSFGLHIELSGTGQDVSARIGAASITGDSGTLLFSLHPDYDPEHGDQIAFEMTGHLAGMTWDTDDSLLPPGWIADTGNLETDGYITLLYDDSLLWNIGDEDEHAGQTWLIDGEDVTSWSAAVFIGNTGAGNELVITNAGTLHLGASNAFLLIGDKEGGDSNRVVVTGAGSSLTVTTGRDIEIGRGSAEDAGGDYNSLVVENNAYLATRRLHVGLRGSNNQLFIRDGAEVLLTGWLRIGHHRGAENNEAHISGEGTTLTTPRIEIGEQAFDDYTGSLLDISDGAEVNVSEHIRIVSGTDSEIRVRGGARVTSASASIAGRANANDNRIVISGEGTTWTNTGAFLVNANAAASGSRLEIRDGAVLNAASQEGTMEVRDGGTLLLDGGTLITPELLVLAGGTLEGAGAIDGNGDIAGGISPGLSAGTLTFTGDLVLREGFEAHFELGGTGDGESDQVVCGILDLDGDGTLYLSALPDYTPASEGDRIVLFDFTSLTTMGGTFLVDESALPAGWSVDDSDLMTDGSITVFFTDLEQDTDGDGIPDWWEEKYFGGPTNADADATSDATGMTNLEKYIAGLEPFNNDAMFVIDEQVVDEEGQVVLRWASVEGRVYTIEASDALDIEDTFTPLTGAEDLSATPPQNTYTVDPVETSSFYRVRVRLE